jgi:large subunit ribosomal protein L5
MSIAKNSKEDYKERIVPALMKEFGYTSSMQVPRLVKIVINRGLGDEHEDKKLIEVAANELGRITGQKAVITKSKKDISNFKLRKGNPIGAMVTLRRDRMYDFLDRLINIALPRIRDFRGLETRMDGHGNYTFGVDEQIIFPEINLDTVPKILGMNITLVTTAQTDEEGYALLREFGLPFKKSNNKSKKATK